MSKPRLTNEEFESERTLSAFVQYCIEHPRERFWQALRNWVALEVDADVSYVLLSPNKDGEGAKDTFYMD